MGEDVPDYHRGGSPTWGTPDPRLVLAAEAYRVIQDLTMEQAAAWLEAGRQLAKAGKPIPR